VSQIVFGYRVLALAGNQVVEVDCENGCIFETDHEAKLLSCIISCLFNLYTHQLGDKTFRKIVSISLADEVLLMNSGLGVEKRFRKPAELDVCEIKSLCCINEYDVVLGLESKDKVKLFMDLYHLDMSSSDSPWTRFFDPTRPRKNISSTLLSTKLTSWDEDLSELVFIGNAASADIGTLGRLQKSDPISTFFLTTEEFLPQLPVSVKDSRADQYPIGVALDFTNPEITPSGSDALPFPASPVLWILTNEGFICAYRVIKNNSRTVYREMNLAVTEFPNILKKRPSQKVAESKKVQAEFASDEPRPRELKPEAPGSLVKEKPFDFSTISSGFVNHDYGKYTNALIGEFMQIKTLVDNDLGQLQMTVAQNNELIAASCRAKHRTIRHLERDTLKLAQDCDNPAFLELFKAESDVFDLAHQVKPSLYHAKSLKDYAGKHSGYYKSIENYRETLASTVTGYKSKIEALESMQNEVSPTSLESLKDELQELERNLSLLKLTNTKGKTSTPTAQVVNASHISKFASRLIKRSSSDCLNIVKAEAKTVVPAAVPKLVEVDPRFYSCVFPVYDEDEFASELEDSASDFEETSEEEPLASFESEFDYEEKSDHISEHGAILAEHSEITSVELGNYIMEELAAVANLSMQPFDIENTIETVVGKSYPEKSGHIASSLMPTAPTPPAEPTDVLDIELFLDFERVRRPSLAPSFELIDTEHEAKASVTGQSEQPAVQIVDVPVAVDSVDSDTVVILEPTAEHVVEPEANAEVIEFTPVSSVLITDAPAEIIEPVYQVEESASVVECKLQEASAIAEVTSTEAQQSMEFPTILEQQDDDMEESEAAPTDNLGFMSISCVAPSSSQPTRNVFGIPAAIPTIEGAGQGFLEPSALRSFAPRLEESIFAKSASISDAPSTFGGFGQSSFGQAPTASPFSQSGFGQSTSFGQTSALNAFSQPAFGASNSAPSAFGGSTMSPFVSASSAFAPPTSAPSAFGTPSAFGSIAFGSSTAAPTFGATDFGQSSFGGGAASFGSPAIPASPSQPAKVFGQGSNLATGVPGFGTLASNTAPSDPQQQQQQQPLKKNLPSSFSQFRE